MLSIPLTYPTVDGSESKTIPLNISLDSTKTITDLLDSICKCVGLSYDTIHNMSIVVSGNSVSGNVQRRYQYLDTTKVVAATEGLDNVRLSVKYD